MSESDPTDHTLAAIASILDHPESHRESGNTTVEEKSTIGLDEADGYHRIGPGPLDSIRFKWSVRRGDDAEYYVDEVVGEHSRPVVTGPLSPAEAIRLVDARESEARLKYESLRTEMSRRVPRET